MNRGNDEFIILPENFSLETFFYISFTTVSTLVLVPIMMN